MDRLSNLILITTLLASGTAHPSTTSRSSTRVLTWWGYIDTKNEKVQEVEKNCKTKISLDEFYSNSEFLNRIGEGVKTNKYDIIIFSDTVIKSSQTAFIDKLKTKITSRSNEYADGVRNFFQSRKYNPSTVAFQISLTGFLIDKIKINARSEDKLSRFFQESSDNVVVLLDDHVEIATLLNNWNCSEYKKECDKETNIIFPTEDKLRKLIGKSKLVISSDLANITNHPKFALAYTWSGDAIQKSLEQPNLEFILHPSLSHTSMDLLTLLGESKEAQCVANALSAKDFVDSVASKSKYFSPFGPVMTQDRNFEELQIKFFKNFSKLRRIHRVTPNESVEIEKNWQIFKILFGSKI